MSGRSGRGGADREPGAAQALARAPRGGGGGGGGWRRVYETAETSTSPSSSMSSMGSSMLEPKASARSEAVTSVNLTRGVGCGLKVTGGHGSIRFRVRGGGKSVCVGGIGRRERAKR